MAEALADRTGEYTPSLTDRRRIAVSELIMVAMNNNGMLMAQNFINAVEHNIVSEDEGMELSQQVMARMKRLAQGGEY